MRKTRWTKAKLLKISQDDQEILIQWLANIYRQNVLRNAEANGRELMRRIQKNPLASEDVVRLEQITTIKVDLKVEDIPGTIKDLRCGKTPKLPTVSFWRDGDPPTMTLSREPE